MQAEKQRYHYRTVWISDLHLGTRSCKGEFLLDFMKTVRCDQLFLVGDIIDLWKARNGWSWSIAQTDVLRRILKLPKKGCRVTFVPGNHDEHFRDFLGHSFAGVEIRDLVEYELADGRKFLVFHGDQFDAFITRYRWLSILGGQAYEWLIALNNCVNWIRKRLGFGYWSLSKFVKDRTKQATMAINNFEQVIAKYARKKGVDGVVCGHIHKPEIKDLDGVIYCNDGDWVENCTALVEHFDGRLEILDWTRERAQEAVLGISEPRSTKLPRAAAI